MKSDKPIYDVPIGGDKYTGGNTDLYNRVMNELDEAGIDNIGELIEFLQHYEGDLSNYGQLSIKELIARLREEGWFPVKKINFDADRPE